MFSCPPVNQLTSSERLHRVSKRILGRGRVWLGPRHSLLVRMWFAFHCHCLAKGERKDLRALLTVQLSQPNSQQVHTRFWPLHLWPMTYGHINCTAETIQLCQFHCKFSQRMRVYENTCPNCVIRAHWPRDTHFNHFTRSHATPCICHAEKEGMTCQVDRHGQCLIHLRALCLILFSPVYKQYLHTKPVLEYLMNNWIKTTLT